MHHRPRPVFGPGRIERLKQELSRAPVPEITSAGPGMLLPIQGDPRKFLFSVLVEERTE